MERIDSQAGDIRPSVTLLTFNSGSTKSLQRITRQASKFPWIDFVVQLSEKDLGDDYFSVFRGLLSANHKGYGLWSWKPYIIERQMDNMNDGDVLIYLDAGVEINSRGSSRFTHYLDFLARNDTLLFSLDHQNRQWTKKSPKIFSYGKDYFRNQVVAGIILLRVSDISRSLIRDWKALTSIEKGALLSDPTPQTPEYHTELIEHRHDQSLLSKVVYEHEIQTIPDESMFKPWRKGKEYPFLALRNRNSSFSWMWWAFHTPHLFWRIVYVATNPILLKGFITRLTSLKK